MRKTVVGMAMYVVFCQMAHAQSQSPVCEKINAAIDLDMKRLSIMTPLGDINAVHESNNIADHQLAATLIQTNITLLEANHCKMPAEPVSQSVYIANASDCSIVSGEGGLTSDELMSHCDISKWTKDFKSK